jgi:cell wall-associated NlpC family hydrolase
LIELVQTLNDLQAVTEAQQKVIHEMETAKQEASDAMTQITALMTEQEEAETLLLEQQEADEASVAELDQVIAEIRENEEAYADEIERLEAERNDLDLEIADAEAQLAAQQEAERLRKEEEERLRKAEEERKAQEAEAARLKAEEERKAQEAEAERKAQEEAEAARQKAEEEQKAQEAAQQPAQSEENTDTEEPKQEETKQEETKKEETKKENTSSSDVTGATVYAYASQFVGNPYVWGGTSLTNGCDCSGFVMQVYAHFGVSLPHSSASLRSVGRAVSVSDMQVGDIVCYSGHVGIYAGDGLLLSALGAKYGITYNSVHYKTILAVRRIF